MDSRIAICSTPDGRYFCTYGVLLLALYFNNMEYSRCQNYRAMWSAILQHFKNSIGLIFLAPWSSWWFAAEVHPPQYTSSHGVLHMHIFMCHIVCSRIVKFVHLSTYMCHLESFTMLKYCVKVVILPNIVLHTPDGICFLHLLIRVEYYRSQIFFYTFKGFPPTRWTQ